MLCEIETANMATFGTFWLFSGVKMAYWLGCPKMQQILKSHAPEA